MSVEFRSIRPDDYQAVCDLIRDEEELFMVYSKGTFPFSVNQFGNMLNRRLEPTVLQVEGKVAGFAAFYRLRKARSAFIGNVVVDLSQRGRGFGKNLVSYMSGLAFDKYGLPEVRISVYNSNTTALLLYASMGFKPYAIQAKRDLKGDRVALITLNLWRV